MILGKLAWFDNSIIPLSLSNPNTSSSDPGLMCTLAVTASVPLLSSVNRDSRGFSIKNVVRPLRKGRIGIDLEDL